VYICTCFFTLNVVNIVIRVSVSLHYFWELITRLKYSTKVDNTLFILILGHLILWHRAMGPHGCCWPGKQRFPLDALDDLICATLAERKFFGACPVMVASYGGRYGSWNPMYPWARPKRTVVSQFHKTFCSPSNLYCEPALDLQYTNSLFYFNDYSLNET